MSQLPQSNMPWDDLISVNARACTASLGLRMSSIRHCGHTWYLGCLLEKHQDGSSLKRRLEPLASFPLCVQTMTCCFQTKESLLLSIDPLGAGKLAEAL
mmetsp:Transcript_7581/g.21059  ORF Transcript_7581/g.21059 Transcript_7581/m.21059 type:complete len:99 (+) Transcript_7581:946-1242(+)